MPRTASPRLGASAPPDTGELLSHRAASGRSQLQVPPTANVRATSAQAAVLFAAPLARSERSGTTASWPPDPLRQPLVLRIQLSATMPWSSCGMSNPRRSARVRVLQKAPRRLRRQHRLTEALAVRWWWWRHSRVCPRASIRAGRALRADDCSLESKVAQASPVRHWRLGPPAVPGNVSTRHAAHVPNIPCCLKRRHLWQRTLACGRCSSTQAQHNSRSSPACTKPLRSRWLPAPVVRNRMTALTG